MFLCRMKTLGEFWLFDVSKGFRNTVFAQDLAKFFKSFNIFGTIGSYFIRTWCILCVIR